MPQGIRAFASVSRMEMDLGEVHRPLGAGLGLEWALHALGSACPTVAWPPGSSGSHVCAGARTSGQHVCAQCMGALPVPATWLWLLLSSFVFGIS